MAITEISGATEERTSKALGIDTTELADWSAILWCRNGSLKWRKRSTRAPMNRRS